MFRKNIIILLLIIAVVSFVLFKFAVLPATKLAPPKNEKLQVFVSILPQKFFVEKIGGDLVEVSVLVGPGQSPATYEPLPKQMSSLAEAVLYFRIGVPFEIVWHERIRSLNPNLEIIDTREGIPLRKIEGSVSKNSDEGVKDPHIWLDPILVKIQAETICTQLVSKDPENKTFYRANLAQFQNELDELYVDLKTSFDSLPVNKLMVFHPAWGYLFDRYGLVQIPIEVEGKEPTPRELTRLVELAKRENIKVIFIEEQFHTSSAVSIADSIGGKVVKLDPLAENYYENLRQIAQIIKGEH